MTTTILVTGFGPFPGAPFNPTGPLVEKLARLRRPRLADVKIAAHVFPTSYTAVDRDLPKLIAEHEPDAILMFGLAPRARALRIETRARNTAALLPDAGGLSPDFDADFPKLAERGSHRPQLLWIACGTEDGLIQINRGVKTWLKGKNVDFTDVETPGAHSWMVWRRNLAAFTPLLFGSRRR